MTDRATETFGDVLRRHASERPKSVALRFGERVTDYATLDAQTNRIANALIAAGVEPGARVAYLGKNSDTAVALALGAGKAGAVLVPIIWRLSPDEIAWILSDCGARLLIVDAPMGDTACALATDDFTVISIGGARSDKSWHDFDTWRDAAPATPPPVKVDADDILIQIYTSGTTGRPKGAMLAHANVTRFRPVIDAEAIGWLTPDPDETAMLVMPFAHIAGVGTALLAIYAGQENIVLSEFDPGQVLDAIERHRLRRLFLVPAALQILLAHPRAETTDFSSLRYFSYGASPIPIELLKAGIARLGCQFVQVYGMTETWGAVTALAPEDHDPDRLHLMASAGRAMPGVELRILDPDGNALPPGMAGEVAIRSPSNMKGYWNRPDETARTLDAQGWIRTGDAGFLDDQGYLFIQDRIKDMIISGGENVYPAEVESALYGHPDIADVAVIGVPDPHWGEAVKAIVVPRPGTNPDADNIIAHARQRIARFKCPKSVDFIDALPRNPSGKILRRELRAPYWAGHARHVN
ncbi:fatty acid--CoA ligase [Sphingomonas colocasiae]|uniref:Fatty acid--CoA ligase n=1 Tax=Sphingomonas colocasiae TaxID=1848973 RepID=A0ABS7PK28_9SPHN|nr:fatty acid--CoA ligase [Sphingomonas colocasiae]MBY8820847.1 fatty acid--CoA ligase [Sphingomonas colocasiae]